MAVTRIPLSNVPQRFSIELAGRVFSMTCKWNPEANIWELDIADGPTGASLISGLPLVTGTDLLVQHEHVGIGGGLVAFTDGDSLAPPTLDNLGAEGNLFFVVA